MSPCICAGACLCAVALFGYVLHTYCQRTEVDFAEKPFIEIEVIRNKSNDSVV